MKSNEVLYNLTTLKVELDKLLNTPFKETIGDGIYNPYDWLSHLNYIWTQYRNLTAIDYLGYIHDFIDSIKYKYPVIYMYDTLSDDNEFTDVINKYEIDNVYDIKALQDGCINGINLLDNISLDMFKKPKPEEVKPVVEVKQAATQAVNQTQEKIIN